MPLPTARKSEPSNVVNLMDALKASLASSGKPAKAAAKSPRAAKKSAAKRKRKAN
jgi:non-homologous end joining protein Ku